MTTEHPARAAGLASQAAVQARDKAAWVNLFAEDAKIEDPIGPSGFDPEGKGHKGPGAIAAFWDMTIGTTTALEFLFNDSFACGNEVAFTGAIRSTIGGHQIDAEGVFTYKVNDAGKIVALRAFWEIDRATATARRVE